MLYSYISLYCNSFQWIENRKTDFPFFTYLFLYASCYAAQHFHRTRMNAQKKHDRGTRCERWMRFDEKHCGSKQVGSIVHTELFFAKSTLPHRRPIIAAIASDDHCCQCTSLASLSADDDNT